MFAYLENYVKLKSSTLFKAEESISRNFCQISEMTETFSFRFTYLHMYMYSHYRFNPIDGYEIILFQISFVKLGWIQIVTWYAYSNPNTYLFNMSIEVNISIWVKNGLNWSVLWGISSSRKYGKIDLRSFLRSVVQNRPVGRSPKIDRDRPTSTDREH